MCLHVVLLERAHNACNGHRQGLPRCIPNRRAQTFISRRYVRGSAASRQSKKRVTACRAQRSMMPEVDVVPAAPIRAQGKTRCRPTDGDP